MSHNPGNGQTCAVCRAPLQPGEAAVHAVEMVHEQDVGGEPIEVVDGADVWFHADHVPDVPDRYRIVDS